MHPYLLRDALLLSVLGGLIFALNAQGWQAPPVFRRLRGLPRPGQMLLLTGLIVALAGGAGLAAGLAGIGGLAATIAWWLGLVLQIVGAWWPGPTVDYAQPQVRWSRDAAGNFVPLAAGVGEDSAAARRALGLQMGRRAWLAWLLVILIAAAFLRFWNLDQLPPGCINQECDAALHLTTGLLEDGPPGSLSSWKSGLLEAGLAGGLAELFVRATGAGVLSLRLAAATLAWLTVLVLAGALQRLVGRPAALLGTALLAISPWHIWASRSSDPWIAAALLAAVTLWLALEALAHTHARWWVAWGIAAGLLAVQAPQLWPGIAVWVAVTGGLGLAQGWRRRRHVGESDLWLWSLAGLGAALGAGLPAVIGAMSSAAVPPPAGDTLAANLTDLAGTLLRPEVSIIGPFVGAGLVNGLVMALAVVGCGALLRHLRQPQAGTGAGGGGLPAGDCRTAQYGRRSARQRAAACAAAAARPGSRGIGPGPGSLGAGLGAAACAACAPGCCGGTGRAGHWRARHCGVNGGAGCRQQRLRHGSRDRHGALYWRLVPPGT